jgi:hypothetical protein
MEKFRDAAIQPSFHKIARSSRAGMSAMAVTEKLPPSSGEQEWVCGTCGASATKPDGRPSGQEWTPETVGIIADNCEKHQTPNMAIADAHNAALTAAIEKDRKERPQPHFNQQVQDYIENRAAIEKAKSA